VSLPSFSEALGGTGRRTLAELPFGELAADDKQLLALVLYWFWEYVEQRISPGDLLDVLTHLLITRNTED